MFLSHRMIAVSLFLGLSAPFNAMADTLAVADEVPFNESADIRTAIRDECRLTTRLSTFVHKYGEDKFKQVVSLHEAPSDASVLQMSIVEAEGNPGGAWSGRKYVVVEGVLQKNGQTIGSFRARRVSNGGLYGQYKGTCSILGRCVKALGRDIANWAAKPAMDSRLGDS